MSKIIPRHVSLRDVAKAAGVSHPTVSRALKGDPRVVEKTRVRIVEVARRLGYSPDPALTALAAYRTSKRRPAHHGRLAYLHPFGGGVAKRECYTIKVFLPLLREKAERLGYTIEVFAFSPTPQEQRRISHILYSRGITGVFVGEMPPGETGLDHIDWRRFSALSLTGSLKSPLLPYITDGTPKRMDLAYEKLRAAGYRKIGYLTRRSIEENADRMFLSSYLRCLFEGGLSVEEHPPYIYDSWRDLQPLPWLKKHRFDAVIAALAEEFLARIEGTRYRVPENLGLSTLFLRSEDPPEVAGCTVDWELWSTVAMELLNNRIHHGEKGTNTLKTGMFIDTMWSEAFSREPTMPPAGV